MPVVNPRSGRAKASGVKRFVKLCGLSICALMVVAVVSIGLLVGYLANGPIVFNSLGDRIAAALQDRFGHGTVFALGTTSIIQHGFDPTIGIDGLSVSGPDGGKILSAPRAEVSIDLLALLTGRIVPKRLEVLDVELRLVLLENGSLSLVASPDAKPIEVAHAVEPAPTPIPPAPIAVAPASGAPPPGDVVAPAPRRAIAVKQTAEAIRAFFDTITNPNGPIAAVDRLGIKRGRLVIDDRTNKAEVVYSDLDLDVDKASVGTTLMASAQGPSQRWSVAALARGTPGAHRDFKISVNNLSPDELQLAAGSRDLGFETDMPISMSFKIGLRPNDTLSEAVGGFEVGPGFFRLDDPDQEPMLIDRLTGGFRWNTQTRQIEIERVDYKAATTQLALSGSVLPPLNEGEPWTIGMATAEPGVLGPDRLGEEPVVIDGGQFAGRLLLDQKKLLIDRFAFNSGKEGGIALAGQLDWEKGPHLRLGASISPTTVRVAKRVWPAFVAAPVRAWMLTHFEDGILQTGTIRIDYDAEALLRMRSDRAPIDDSVALDFSVTKARVAYLPGVPPLENVEGVGRVTGRTSHFILKTGTMDASGRKISLSDGEFAVGNADVHPAAAEISAHVSGSVEAISDILARDALRPYAAIPLNPATLKGQVDGRLQDNLLLGGPTNPGGNVLRINAVISNFVADKLIGKEKLDNSTVTLAVDPAGMKATGQGRIFGGAATFDITRVGDKSPDAVINVTLDDAARAKLGLTVIPGLTGPLAARIATTLGGPPDRMKAQVELDLSRMGVTAAFLGLSKPAGKAAKVSLAIAMNENRMAVDPISIDIGTLQAHGAIEMGADNSFQSARFSSLKISPGDDMKLDVGKVDDAFKLTIRGSTIDARPFLRALTQTPGETPALAKNAKAERKEAEAFKGFDIDLKCGILTGFNKEVLSDVDLHLTKRGPQIRQFSVKGRFGRQMVSGTLTPAQRMHVETQDAGALFAFIDLYKHMEGGLLSASMRVGDDTLDGNLDIKDFVLRDEPAMKKLVAQSVASSRPGDSASTAARSVDANAVGFTRLKVDFQRSGSHLDLKNATMYGKAIGLSVDGWLDYVNDTVDMTGTFVPAFEINNLFSQVPVIGVLLGGASNEGLFAIKFRISGSASTPTLSVNPLSAIAPGFVRNIFGAFDAGGQKPAFPGAAGR